MRREFPAKVKVAAYERAGKRCEVCTAPLYPGKFQYDHITADVLGGEPTLENCRVICNSCHKRKSAQDVAMKAKADRQRNKHLGAKPSRWPKSAFKRKVSGETVRRDE